MKHRHDPLLWAGAPPHRRGYAPPPQTDLDAATALVRAAIVGLAMWAVGISLALLWWWL